MDDISETKHIFVPVCKEVRAALAKMFSGENKNYRGTQSVFSVKTFHYHNEKTSVKTSQRNSGEKKKAQHL